MLYQKQVRSLLNIQVIVYVRYLKPFSGLGCETLKLLTIAAATANPVARYKQVCVLLLGTRLNIMATKVAPNVCPNKRAVPSIPLAPPLRLAGADEMIVLLFGVWNKSEAGATNEETPYNIHIGRVGGENGKQEKPCGEYRHADAP